MSKRKRKQFISPLLIDTAQLAERIGFEVGTLEKRRSCFPETLPAHYQIFSLVRYLKPEVDTWIAARMPERPLVPTSGSQNVPGFPTAEPDAPLRDTKWLAQLLGVSVSCIEKRRSTKPHTLPPHSKPRNRVRYSEADVYAWLAKQRVES
jgi:predicted DNA-binding transcriptional regulator AlpA